MQIVLQKNVPHLGLVGDVVNVANGYYRNYLAPRDLAFLANPKSIKQVTHQKKIIEGKKAKQKDEALVIQSKMEATVIKLEHLAGQGDKLFGSITSQEIIASLQTSGFIVDRKVLVMEGPIKTLGDHTVGIKLHPEVTATIRLEVYRKAEDKKDEEAREPKKEKAPKVAKEEKEEEKSE